MVMFSRPEYQALIRDYDTLAKLNTVQGDKLSVEKNVLEISEGGFLQAPKRTIKNLIYGGHNRENVTKYLEDLAKKTKQFADELLENPEIIKNNPRVVKGYAKKIGLVASAMSDLEYNYREEGPFSFKNEACAKLSNLFDQFKNINKLLKEELKKVDMPARSTPKPPIDFEAPINLKRIKLKMSKSQTPEDVLLLAKNAEKQMVPLWKKISVIALSVLATIIIAIPLQFLTTLKWVIWNPIEFIVKGKVSTKNPISWWATNISQLWTRYTSKAPKDAIERYAMQLLRAPIITERHVEAFSQISQHVKEIDLVHTDIGSNDFDELMSIIEKDRKFKNITKDKFGPNATQALKQLLDGLDGKLVKPFDFELFLMGYFNSLHLQWIDNPNFNSDKASDKVKTRFLEWKEKFDGDQENAQARLDYFMKTVTLDECLEGESKRVYITPKNLGKLIEIAGKNTECRQIKIPQQGSKLTSEVLSALKISGFKQDPEREWIYAR
jgi:hypothetical protein